MVFDKHNDMHNIIIFDTTLRDGEQSPGASMTIEEKLIVAKQLAKMGVDVIEAGFPIASEGDFESVKRIADEVKGPVICGLCRAMKTDIDRCWEAIKESNKPRIHTFIATSQIHIDNKFRKSKEDIIIMAAEAVSHAKKYCDDVEFSCEDASRTDMDYMCDVIRAAIKAGATTINIPDTVGYAEPEEFGRRIKHVIDNVTETNNIILSVHCHNDLGNAVANSLAAVKNGAKQVECCVNGIGERAGNASTEEIVMNLNTRSDYFGAKTNIDTKEICRTSRLVSKLTGLPIARSKPIVGTNAFAHESGIHQHGVINNSDTYEIMKPEDVGWSGERLVIGKHSGKHAIESVVKEEGFDLTKDQIEKITIKVKELADKQKNVERDDLIAIAADEIHQLSEKEQIIKLEEFSVMTGNNSIPTASVKLIFEGKEKTGVGNGVGPVDALSNAIWDIIGPRLKLAEYNLKAITGGTNALAEVLIKLSDEHNRMYSGSGINEDVIKASAIAIINGANKAFNIARLENEGIRKEAKSGGDE